MAERYLPSLRDAEHCGIVMKLASRIATGGEIEIQVLPELPNAMGTARWQALKRALLSPSGRSCGGPSP
jgi:hypothetical protein